MTSCISGVTVGASDSRIASRGLGLPSYFGAGFCGGFYSGKFDVAF